MNHIRELHAPCVCLQPAITCISSSSQFHEAPTKRPQSTHAKRTSGRSGPCPIRSGLPVRCPVAPLPSNLNQPNRQIPSPVVLYYRVTAAKETTTKTQIVKCGRCRRAASCSIVESIHHPAPPSLTPHQHPSQQHTHLFSFCYIPDSRAFIPGLGSEK